jgi:hypothetical protein
MVWLRAVLRRNFPGVTIPEMIDLEDVSMLENTVREWSRKERSEGRKEGLKDGRQEGMRKLLIQMLDRRFGPLPSEQRNRVEAITSPARLKRLANKVMTANSLDEMGI